MNNKRCIEVRPPPIIGSFFKGWPPTFYENKDDLEYFEDADDKSFSSRSSSLDSLPENYHRRRSSIQVGNEVAFLLEEENVKNAVDVLQDALGHLNMAQQKFGHDSSTITEIYSKIIKTLCDPNISKIVDKLTPGPKHNIYNSVLWRLFTKIVESGHTLQVCFIFLFIAGKRGLLIKFTYTRQMLI